MSNEKQTHDALATLGTIIDEHQRRDAIHVAVAPVIAGSRLDPGAHVGLLSDGSAGQCDTPLGVVDPFLCRAVEQGERFWLFVYPRQTTSLRHAWTHPGFPDEGEIATPAEVATPVSVTSVAEASEDEDDDDDWYACPAC